ncbi:hypothetical protein ACIP1X_02105 [Pseudomonas sp. NPDC088885]|jgi:hypothetical protein|uniref:hypothetical protein n=1 Tax=Pseudomonas sp. NPDC088885 TaxID=3364457 RepID=UPI003829E7D0
MPFYAVTFLRIFVVAWVGVALAQIIYGRSDVAALDRVVEFNPGGLEGLVWRPS